MPRGIRFAGAVNCRSVCCSVARASEHGRGAVSRPLCLGVRLEPESRRRRGRHPGRPRHGRTGGLNGAMFSLGLDTLCKKDADYFRRLKDVRATCDRHGIAFIPAIFSVGYGGAVLVARQKSGRGAAGGGCIVSGAGFRGQIRSRCSGHARQWRLRGVLRQSCRGHAVPRSARRNQLLRYQVRHSGTCLAAHGEFSSESPRPRPRDAGRQGPAASLLPDRAVGENRRASTRRRTEVQVLADNRTLAPHDFSLPETTRLAEDHDAVQQSRQDHGQSLRRRVEGNVGQVLARRLDAGRGRSAERVASARDPRPRAERRRHGDV